MSKNVWEFLLKKMDDYRRKKDDRIQIIISHNRVLEVERIESKDFKEWWKISENEDFIILDKDYWKSAELMRALLEKKKKMPFWVFVLLIVWWIIFSIIILIITYKVIMSVIAPPVPVATENNQVIKTTPLVVNPVKQTEIITNSWSITNSWNIATAPIIDLEKQKLEDDYMALQLAYNEEIKKTCEIKEKIIEVPKEIFIEKKLTEKEKFLMNLWNEIFNKCDNLIKNNINDAETETCKNLYSKYILTIQ